MALSPADFAAYSRATGTPYPEDPEERAQLAPSVAEFRRNQLRAPQQESNLPAIVGASLAGLSVLAGGAYGLSRLGRKAPSVQARKPQPGDINIAANATEQIKRATTPAPSRVPGSSVESTAPTTAIPQSTVDLTTIQQSQQPSISVQATEAVDGGLDQAITNLSVIPEQRQVNGFKSFSQDVDRIAREARLQEVTNQFPTEVANVARVRQGVVSGNPWELEELLEEGGRQAQELLSARYERGGRTIADLTGELEVSPALGKQLRKSGINVRGSSVARPMREETGKTVPLSRKQGTFPGTEGYSEGDTVYYTGKGAGRSVALSQFSDTPAREGIGVNRFTPNELLERTMAAASYPREVRDMLLDPAIKLSDVVPLGAVETRDAYLNKYMAENADRLYAESKQYASTLPENERSSYESTYVKNPVLFKNPPTPAQLTLTQFLGRTPQVRGGAVSINPTMEIAGGARASMPGASVEELQTASVGGRGLTYADTTNLKQLQQKEKLEQAGVTFDPNTGNYYQEVDVPEVDPTEYMTRGPQMGTDYGDTEGVGNLLIETESFRERTNQGTTQIPGFTQQMSGLRGGSERQERSADFVIPLRRTAEGQQTTGMEVVADPELSFGRQLRSQDTGYRQGGRLTSEDLSAQGTRLPGGFETAQANVAEVIDTMPVTEWRQSGGQIRGTDGKLYSAVGLEIVGEQPLVGFKRAPLMESDPVTGQARRVGFTTPEKAALVPVALSRQVLQQVAEDAKNAYFNNPSAKLRYLQERNPEALELGRAQGKTLAEIGEPYDYQGFITQQLDNYLMNNEGIDLPVLKPDVDAVTGQQRLNKEGSTFAMNLLKTEKSTPVFGEEFLIDPNTGQRVPLRDDKGKIMTNRGGYVIYQTTGKKVAVPGKYDVTGGGGVDPMAIGEDYDKGSVAFFTPRIDTASQQKVMRQGRSLNVPASSILGTTSTPLGAQLSVLREQMSTPQTGVGMRTVPVRNPQTGNVVGKQRVSTMNIGSFARTQNPYTGPAAPAMGPVSRVISGNYQYTDPQLKVNLEPVSSRQQQERNQFAYTANLTPGGRVKTGALNLSGNLGIINAGVGNLTEAQTIQQYGLTGGQLQQFGRQLMDQAAQRRNLPSGPTSVSAAPQTPSTGGSRQLVIPGVLEGSPLTPRGYTANPTLDFYERSLEQEAAQLAANQPRERLVRRQGRMVPLSQVTQPVQRNVFFPAG
jgi:hypothetical protein